MNDRDTNEILCAVLDLLKRQAIYLERQQGWISALYSAIESEPSLAQRLREHPFYDQGPAPSLRSSAETIQIIDSIVQKLKG